jgi:hypothetical protein
MKLKLPVSLISALFILFSCGEVRKELQVPSYKFEPGKPLLYKTFLKVRLTIGMGFIKYTERFTMNSDLYITAVETNSNGYKIKLELKNNKIDGADTAGEQYIEEAINYLNSGGYYSMTRSGKGLGAPAGSSDSIQSAFGEVILPDISGPIPGDETNYFKSGFPARVGGREVSVSQTGGREICLSNNILSLRDTMRFITSENPLALGDINFESEDKLNIFPGEMTGKKGTFRVNFSMTTGEGFLQSSLDIDGKGDFDIRRQDGP